jgi:hypothetical protein
MRMTGLVGAVPVLTGGFPIGPDAMGPDAMGPVGGRA